MKRSMLLLATAALVLCAAGNALASAYAIPEQSARATAMGATGTAAVNGPDAIYFNPAALSKIKDPAVSLGLTIVAPAFTLENSVMNAGAAEDDEIGTFYIPSLFTSLSPGMEKVTIGLGVYAPYGLGSDWSETGIARYASYHGYVNAIYVSPAISYEVIPGLSLGATVSYISGKGELGQKFPLAMINPALPGDGDVAFEGDGTAFGWSGGILYRITPSFSAGISYRSAATLDLDGTASYSDLAVMADITVDGKTELPLPAVTSLGIAYNPTAALQIAFDVNYTQWSDFDTLVLDVEDKYAGTPIGGLVRDTTRPENWEDTWTFRLGAEYMATDALALRLGAFYDQNPIPDETLGPFLPDSDRIGVSGGVGYAVGKLSFNLGYLALFFTERTVANSVLPYPGEDTYTGFTHLLTASASYSF